MDYSKKEVEGLLHRKFSVNTSEYFFTENNECIKPNWHEKFEFILIDSGALTITLNTKIVRAEAGTLIVVAANVLHSADCNICDCRCKIISFDINTVLDDTIYEQSLRNNLLNHSVIINDIITDSKAVSYFNDLYNVCGKKLLSQPILEKGYACIFFSYLIENFSQKNSFFQTANSKFDNVLEYIYQNYTKSITTKQIAQRFSYNKSYFCRKFQKITNLTPTEFILTLRIEHSQKLMTNSSLSLNDIAQQSGFSSYPYFSLKFKETVGFSPAEWRNTFFKKNNIET